MIKQILIQKYRDSLKTSDFFELLKSYLINRKSKRLLLIVDNNFHESLCEFKSNKEFQIFYIEEENKKQWREILNIDINSYVLFVLYRDYEKKIRNTYLYRFLLEECVKKYMWEVILDISDIKKIGDLFELSKTNPCEKLLSIKDKVLDDALLSNEKIFDFLLGICSQEVCKLKYSDYCNFCEPNKTLNFVINMISNDQYLFTDVISKNEQDPQNVKHPILFSLIDKESSPYRIFNKTIFKNINHIYHYDKEIIDVNEGVITYFCKYLDALLFIEKDDKIGLILGNYLLKEYLLKYHQPDDTLINEIRNKKIALVAGFKAFLSVSEELKNETKFKILDYFFEVNRLIFENEEECIFHRLLFLKINPCKTALTKESTIKDVSNQIKEIALLSFVSTLKGNKTNIIEDIYYISPLLDNSLGMSLVVNSSLEAKEKDNVFILYELIKDIQKVKSLEDIRVLYQDLLHNNILQQEYKTLCILFLMLNENFKQFIPYVKSEKWFLKGDKKINIFVLVDNLSYFDISRQEKIKPISTYLPSITPYTHSKIHINLNEDEFILSDKLFIPVSYKEDEYNIYEVLNRNMISDPDLFTDIEKSYDELSGLNLNFLGLNGEHFIADPTLSSSESDMQKEYSSLSFIFLPKINSGKIKKIKCDFGLFLTNPEKAIRKIMNEFLNNRNDDNSNLFIYVPEMKKDYDHRKCQNIGDIPSFRESAKSIYFNKYRKILGAMINELKGIDNGFDIVLFSDHGSLPFSINLFMSQSEKGKFEKDIKEKLNKSFEQNGENISILEIAVSKKPQRVKLSPEHNLFISLIGRGINLYSNKKDTLKRVREFLVKSSSLIKIQRGQISFELKDICDFNSGECIQKMKNHEIYYLFVPYQVPIIISGEPNNKMELRTHGGNSIFELLVPFKLKNG